MKTEYLKKKKKQLSIAYSRLASVVAELKHIHADTERVWLEEPDRGAEVVNTVRTAHEIARAALTLVNLAQEAAERSVLKATGEPMWLVVQQGGSTAEMYASLYDSEKEAKKAKKGHEKSSYSSMGPIEVSPHIADQLRQAVDSEFECELIKLLAETASQAAVLECYR